MAEKKTMLELTAAEEEALGVLVSWACVATKQMSGAPYFLYEKKAEIESIDKALNPLPLNCDS